MKSAHPGAASCRAGVRVAADQRRAVSELFAHVEITMFAGRSGQTSVVSIANLSARSLQLESQRWTSPVILESAPENWGVRGGQPASEVDLGFAVEI